LFRAAAAFTSPRFRRNNAAMPAFNRGHETRSKTMAYSKVLELKNEVEANLLASILEERAIPHLIKRRANPAFEGFFQREFGWGWVEAEPESAEAIREIYADLHAPGSGEETAGDDRTH
jgi:hypothetical protein